MSDTQLGAVSPTCTCFGFSICHDYLCRASVQFSPSLQMPVRHTLLAHSISVAIPQARLRHRARQTTSLALLLRSITGRASRQGCPRSWLELQAPSASAGLLCTRSAESTSALHLTSAYNKQTCPASDCKPNTIHSASVPYVPRAVSRFPSPVSLQSPVCPTCSQRTLLA